MTSLVVHSRALIVRPPDLETDIPIEAYLEKELAIQNTHIKRVVEEIETVKRETDKITARLNSTSYTVRSVIAEISAVEAAIARKEYDAWRARTDATPGPAPQPPELEASGDKTHSDPEPGEDNVDEREVSAKALRRKLMQLTHPDRTQNKRLIALFQSVMESISIENVEHRMVVLEELNSQITGILDRKNKKARRRRKKADLEKALSNARAAYSVALRDRHVMQGTVGYEIYIASVRYRNDLLAEHHYTMYLNQVLLQKKAKLALM